MDEAQGEIRMIEENEEQQVGEMAGIPQVREILDMSLDLSKDEKLRATALMMAVSYHKETIVKDGSMYQTMKANGTNLRPSQPAAVLDAAIVFEGYLRGHYNDIVADMVLGINTAMQDLSDYARAHPHSDGGGE
jgi:hypothetical protein